MTEKECKNALKTIISRGGDMTELIYWSAAMLDEVELLDKLIAEHFKKETPLKVDTGMFASIRCHRCGAKVNKLDNYCSNCGQNLDWSGF